MMVMLMRNDWQMPSLKMILLNWFIPPPTAKAMDTTIDKDRSEYALFACSGPEDCPNIIDVQVGQTTRNEWFFIRRSRFCDSLAVALPINFVLNCDERSQGCCEYREDWPVIFEISLESMSREAYAFWESAEGLRNNNGLLFDTFPFPLNSNVTCQGCEEEVFGYFRTASTTIKRERIIL